MKRLLLFFCIFLLIFPTAQAGLTDSAADAVARGVAGFFVAAADKMFEMGITDYAELDDPDDPDALDDSENDVIEAIYNLATWTPDPFEFPVVEDLIDFSKSLFTPLYSMILLAGFCSLLIVYSKPSVAQHVKDIIGIDIGRGLHVYGAKAIEGLGVAAFTYVFIFFILMLNDVLAKAVMMESLDALSPSPDNFILYFLMAVAYLGMSLLFGYRILVIFLFTSFALLVGACFMMDVTRQTAIGLVLYFVQTVFYQTINIIYYTASILIIQSLNIPFPFAGVMYLVMILMGIVIGIKMLFGTSVIRWAVRVVL